MKKYTQPIFIRLDMDVTNSDEMISNNNDRNPEITNINFWNENYNFGGKYIWNLLNVGEQTKKSRFFKKIT